MTAKSHIAAGRAPAVSVVMNCFNGEAFLGEALQSVRAQSFQDWELVFWDNQSTDASAQLVQAIGDPRIRYFRAPVHSRLGAARNRAVAQARGKWLAFLDCDDRWMPDKLQLQLQAARAAPDVGLVYGPVELAIDGGAEARSSLERYYRRAIYRAHGAKRIFDDLLEGNFIIFSTLLMRRDLYDAVGGINDRLSQNEDYELLLKVSRLTNAVCIETPCAEYRIHANNASHTQAEMSFVENMEIFDALPSGRAVDRARRINATKYAFYKLKRGQVGAGLSLFIRHGSVAWALRRAYSRITT